MFTFIFSLIHVMLAHLVSTYYSNYYLTYLQVSSYTFLYMTRMNNLYMNNFSWGSVGKAGYQGRFSRMSSRALNSGIQEQPLCVWRRSGFFQWPWNTTVDVQHCGKSWRQLMIIIRNHKSEQRRVCLRNYIIILGAKKLHNVVLKLHYNFSYLVQYFVKIHQTLCKSI